MNWKIKASLQKILALTSVGDKLNHISVTLNKKYHYNVALYQTCECIRKFNYSKIDFSDKKTALEIGTGYSLISSVVLSLIGFDKIITVDVTKDISFSTFKKQIKHIESTEILERITASSVFSKKEIIEKLKLIKHKKSLESLFDLLNITYLASYDFEDIEKHKTEFDYITSQVVLEHVTPNFLTELFKNTKKWLTKKGICVHTINFIDHFSNPGFFQDKTISEFNFLKYSDQHWKFWAGNSIAYTNRLSYLYYMEMCKEHQLTVVDFIGENYRKRIALDLKLIHNDILKKYKSLTNIEELTKFQRGTLIISK